MNAPSSTSTSRIHVATTTTCAVWLYLAAILVAWHYSSKTPFSFHENSVSLATQSQQTSSHYLETTTTSFVCPNITTKALPAMSQERLDMYNQQASSIDNLTLFLNELHNNTFDAWGKSFQQVKHDLYDWKLQFYLPYLESGDMIYESATGIGLNLLLTMQILREHGLTHLVAHGNDLAYESVSVANQILSTTTMMHDSSFSQQHVVCVGNSVDLYYVPSNTYQLVFTGYITPLEDPFGWNLPTDDNFQRLEQLCSSQQLDWKDSTLLQLAQQRQEEWFAVWVGEMIRIAKPGAPVIVEQVSPPFCQAKYDWGGVEKEFWQRAIDTYGWDIDPNSVVFKDDSVFGTRYHVFMRKRGDGGTGYGYE